MSLDWDTSFFRDVKGELPLSIERKSMYFYVGLRVGEQYELTGEGVMLCLEKTWTE